MPDIDPRKLNFRGDDEYAPGPDGRIYNRQGNETWQSKCDHNVQETNANRQEQQRLAKCRSVRMKKEKSRYGNRIASGPQMTVHHPAEAELL